MKTSSSEWLSPRECEVLQHLAKGESFKWIAFKLDIHTGTAQRTAFRAYQKLGVNDRYDAVARHPLHRPTPSRFCHRIVSITSTLTPSSTNI